MVQNKPLNFEAVVNFLTCFTRVLNQLSQYINYVCNDNDIS